ncbi:hypothetical protein B0A50_00179 [Salinomyces thailandicus]|uniref:PPM-type phosphatase domain-containing protein n=1 Tax=Salinomyces thailandicus TaxID=706561 RepID=A0A4V5N626_9PEZI|nr:hypothetical protein B0A50_00179 [Salinomyces thailandica]
MDGSPMFVLGVAGLDLNGRAMKELLCNGLQMAAAANVPAMTLELAQELLNSRASLSVSPTVLGHTAQLPSNLPCEDAVSSSFVPILSDRERDWSQWSIYDGHDGPRTAQMLHDMLPFLVGSFLSEAAGLSRLYKPRDGRVIEAIRKAFVFADDLIVSLPRDLVQSGGSGLATTVAMAALSQSGSCALMALYDSGTSVLRVANTGDSRAVLGTWSAEDEQYVAMPMSQDQTGFNEDRVERTKRDDEHEEPVGSKSGRTLETAVSRAFGDARWKWPKEIIERAHEMFWGPAPRPGGFISTVPHSTVDPVMSETEVRTGARPDFLIMASGSLWDVMSSEDAVACVQLWLEKNKPTDCMDTKNITRTDLFDVHQQITSGGSPTLESMFDVPDDEDTYYDKERKCLKWRVSPKHFVNEDRNCGVNMIKNALGGKRRGLFTGLMSLQPPLSKTVRDDITVQVFFFGVDTQDLKNN